MQRDATKRAGTDEQATPRRLPGLTRQQHMMLAVMFVLALGLRVAFWMGQVENNPLIDDPLLDEAKHHEWAQSILSGEGLGDEPFFRAPLYYYLLAGFYAIFGVNPMAARLAGCLLGAVSCYLIARLGIVLGGFRVGLIAGLVAAGYWPLIYFDAQLLTVGVEIFLNLLMLLLLLRAVQRDAWWLFVLAGAAWGLSAVARPNVLTLAPGLLIWLWIAMAGLRAKLRANAVVFGSAALLILPVTIRNYAVSGEFVLIASNGGVNFYIGNNPLSDGVAAFVPGTRPTWEGGYEDTHRIVERELGRRPTEVEVSRYWFSKAGEWILSDPGAWALLTLQKARMFWSPQELYNNLPIRFFAEMSRISVLFWIGFPVVACLGTAGLLTIGRNRLAWRAWCLPLLFAGIYSATVIAFFVPARYRLPVVPVLILATAQGLVRLPEYWRARNWRMTCAYVTLAGLCALFLSTNPPRPAALYHQKAAGHGHHNLATHFKALSQAQPQMRELAAFHFLEAMRLRPDDTYMAQATAKSLVQLGYPQRAEELAVSVAARYPDNAKVLQFYGEYLAFTGRVPEAIREFEKLIDLEPQEHAPHVMIGTLLMATRRETEARAHMDKAIELGADPLEVWHDLGSILVAQGRDAAALEEFDRVLERDPTHVGAARALAALLSRTGRYAEAVAVLRATLEHVPNDADVLGYQAWMLATAPVDAVRNGAEAVHMAEHALKVSGRPTIRLLDTLAAAYAEAGRFEDAVTVSEQALSAARETRQETWAREIESRLEGYRQGQAHRERRSAPGPQPDM
jgi:tetratricopeptide (TPR) repeat protein